MASLDFSPLDFRNAILSDPAGKAISGTISNVARSTAGGIEKVQQKKAKIEKDFIDQMSYDTSITGNNIINNRVSSEYGKLRDKYLKVFADRKGWLKPEDLIALRSDMSALTSLANSLQGVQKMYDNARKTALQDKMKFELDTDGWGKLMGVVTGEQDTGNLIGFLNEIQRSDTEFPFLNYRPYDLGSLINKARKDYRSQFKGDTKKNIVTKESGGKLFTHEIDVTDYGSEDQARQYFKDYFLGTRDPENYNKGLQQSMSDGQKSEALKMYGPMSENQSKTPYLDYFVNDMMDAKKFTAPEKAIKYQTKPSTGTNKGGLSLFFGGGGQAGPDQYIPKADNVEGIEFTEYVEFAKAGRTPKTAKGVTVSGAQRIKEGSGPNAAKDLTTPQDYQVVGYSLDKNRIILTQQERSQFGQVTKTYMVPYIGNEHFLDKLFDDETLTEIKRRADMEREAPIQETGATGMPDWMEQGFGGTENWSDYELK